MVTKSEKNVYFRYSFIFPLYVLSRKPWLITETENVFSVTKSLCSLVNCISHDIAYWGLHFLQEKHFFWYAFWSFKKWQTVFCTFLAPCFEEEEGERRDTLKESKPVCVLEGAATWCGYCNWHFLFTSTMSSIWTNWRWPYHGWKTGVVLLTTCRLRSTLCTLPHSWGAFGKDDIFGGWSPRLKGCIDQITWSS